MMKHIDFNQLLGLVEKGFIGKLVEIETAKGDIIEVSDGYAKNFLLKKGLAEVATASGINEIRQKRTAEAYHKAENVKAFVKTLAGMKPASSSGVYLQQVALSSTQGVGVKVSIPSIVG